MPRSSLGSSEGAGLAAVAELRARVFSTNACDAIPGCPIKIETFLPRMWSAVAKGVIPQAEGEQLQEGLLRGFKLGVDPNLMAGHRWFQNYPSATTTGRTSVAAAVAKRVDAGKTLALGPMTDGLAHALRSTFTASCIFPLGAAAKALLPGREARPSAGAAGGAAEHGGLGVPRRRARFQVVARQVVLAAAAVARRGSRPSLADVLGQG